MNNDLYTKLDGTAKLRLSNGEKEAIRVQVYRYMQEFPLLSKVAVSPYTFAFMRHAAPIIAVLVLVVSSGTAYAAQGSLPGDVLYPMKISLNEQVQSALALSPSAKAEVHASLAERRLEEAQALAVKGELTTKNTKIIQSNFKEHAEVARSLTVEVGKTDPVKAAQLTTQLASSITVNGAVLTSIANDSTSTSTKADAQALVLEVQTAVVIDAQSGTSTNTNGTTNMAKENATTTVAVSAAQTTRVLEAIKTKVFKASSTSTIDHKTASDFGLKAKDTLQTSTQQFNSLSASLDATTSLALQDRLDTIRDFQSIGDTALQSGANDEAFAAYTQSLGASLRLQTILKALQKYKSSVILPMLDKHLDLGEVLGTTTQDTSQEASSTRKADTPSASATTTIHTSEARILKILPR